MVLQEPEGEYDEKKKMDPKLGRDKNGSQGEGIYYETKCKDFLHTECKHLS